jgi:alkylated DNA repair dioxygenase AlkB
LDTIPWKQDEVVMFGKKIMTKRKVAWYADAGINYTYAGVKKSGLQWTEPLLKIKQKVEAITGANYNACLLNLYHEGEEGMGWHRDNEKEIVAESSIASVSLGAARKFAFKHATTNERIDIELENGSLLDMKGAIQHHWYHSLPKSMRIKQLRINLTFRLMHA